LLSVLIAALVSFTVLAAWVPRMVSFAVGAMLAAAFMHLLPEAIMQGGNIQALFAVTLGGLLAFFLLEKFAIWRHGHNHPAASHEHAAHAHGSSGHPLGTMIVIGDGFHNFVDGVLIAAAFLVDVRIGLATTLAIIAHEIPQEIGDFLVLLHAGYTRARALLLNVFSSLAGLIGGITGYFALDYAYELTPYVLALAGSSFIYIAVADLIPHLQRATGARTAMWQIALIAAGIGVIALVYAALHPH
jgi:zinc and cadmium transporter